MGKTKRCPACGLDKLTSEFYRSSSRYDGCAVYCKTCEEARKDLKKAANRARKYYRGLSPSKKKKRSEVAIKRKIKNPQKHLLGKARYRAQKNGLEFSIEESDISIPIACPVLGIPLIIGGKFSTRDNSPTIDRIDNSKGYIKGNVHVISWRANKIKGDATLEELEKVVNYVRRSR